MPNITEAYVKKNGIWTPSKNVYIKKDGAWKEGSLKLKANGEWIEKSQSNYDPILANNTWEQIAQAAKEGVAKDIWKVGDTINLITNNKYYFVFTIVDFNHVECDGSISPIVFCSNMIFGEKGAHSGNIMSLTKLWKKMLTYWDSSSSVYISNCNIIKKYMKTIPKEFKGHSSNVIENVTVFMPSLTEVGGTAQANDGKPFAYYNNNASRIKRSASTTTSGSSNANSYLTRTANGTALASWHTVKNTGDFGLTTASSTTASYYGCFAFVIG